MLHIVCVNHGNFEKRGAQYVNILFDMVRRNLAEGFKGKFVCFTDDPAGLDPGIEPRELPGGLIGWWNKLYLFKEGVFDEGDRVVYFDLDTLIVGRLDEIVQYDGEFAIMRDLFHETPYGGSVYNRWQSAVMAWCGGFGHHLWARFVAQGCPNVTGGDQVWIAENQPTADILQDLFPGKFCSYKANGRKLPKTESVVCFHGRPRPHEVVEGWVPDVWKRGGMTRGELDTVCNTETAIINANIAAACHRDLPWLDSKPDHDRHVCIVGGSPSLPNALLEIRAMQSFGHEVWALNNAHDYLIEHGIVPDAAIMLDARPENADFWRHARQDVRYYVASQCHADVFRMVRGRDAVLYHNATEGAQETIEHETDATQFHLIGGGTTVGMKALVVARFLGFKNFHLYGMDGCYIDDAHHAYPQELNDGERLLEVDADGRKFRCAPWMVTQANDFVELCKMLVEDDGVLTVHGDGLLAHLARRMAEESTPDTGIQQIDGVWWPSKDREARPFIMDRATRDLPEMVALCKERRVCVQAGGNVGVWPQLFAQHFDTVYTFEPDWLNFLCLARNAGNNNVVKFQAALGQAREMVGMTGSPANCGARRVDGPGIVPTMLLDDLRLPACDLLQLDVEGYELFALHGARWTIDEYRPVIVVEINGLSDKHGGRAEIERFLAEFGYTLKTILHRDYVYTSEGTQCEAS